ncbi:MAG: hypothetical protein ACRCYR_01080 [Phycicoccus sp.]
MPGGHVQQGTPGHGPGPVVVDGWHVLAGEVSAQLRRCSIGVRAGAHAGLAAEIELDAGGAAPPAVVLVAAGRLPTVSSAPWQRHGVPHLPVSAGSREIVVGPLVVPGRTPCLVCAGAVWPATREPGPVPGAPGAAAVLAAAIASVTVLATLRGDYSLGGISTEIAHDGQSFVHRLWKVRADCRCASVRMAG